MRAANLAPHPGGDRLHAHMTLVLETAVYQSPIGPLRLVEEARGPLVVEYPGRSNRVRWTVRVRGATPALEVREGGCDRTRSLLDDYFDGKPRPFRYPQRLSRWFDPSPAMVAVHRAICRIPFGATRSYADLARQTGLHPRLVGQLVGANNLAILVPCHRVVGSRGELVGYGGGLNRKRWLLAHEERHARLVLR